MNDYMNDLCFGRFLGNYCPPRSTKESRLHELKIILREDKRINPSNIWILNRIYDLEYLNEIKNILSEGEQNFLEIPFIYEEYKEIQNDEEKLRYTFNLNNARNTVVKEGLKKYDYVICSDGDLFIPPSRWIEINENIQQNPTLPYYALWCRRVTMQEVGGAVKKLNAESLDEKCHSIEPMLIFTKKSTMFFDENLYYNDNCKNELCFRIGMNHNDYLHSSMNMNNEIKIHERNNPCGKNWATAGVIYHIALEDREEQEINQPLRKRAREKAIKNIPLKIKEFYEF